MTNYLMLQNGSDIRGVCVEHGDEKVNFTPEIAYKLGRSFINLLAKRTGKNIHDLSVYVGHDSRISAEPLKKRCIIRVL